MNLCKNKFGWGYLLVALMLIVTGACFVAFSGAINALAIAMGIILAVYGIVFGIITLAGEGRGALFALRVALSIIFICSGVVTAILRQNAILIISNCFCLLLIVDGAFKLATAVRGRRYRLGSWWVITVLATVVIVAAFLDSKIPAENHTTLSVLLGLTIIADGVNNVLTPFYLKAIGKRECDELLEDLDIIDGEK